MTAGAIGAPTAVAVGCWTKKTDAGCRSTVPPDPMLSVLTGCATTNGVRPPPWPEVEGTKSGSIVLPPMRALSLVSGSAIRSVMRADSPGASQSVALLADESFAAAAAVPGVTK